MAAAVVTVIVEDILQSLEEGMKLGQQWGIEHEIIEIRKLLSSIQGVLPKVEDKYGRSLELQKWVKNLKHVTFDVEDLLEELSVEDAHWQHQTKVCRLVRAIHRLRFWWRIRDELRVVARQLQDLIMSDWVGLLRNIPDEIRKTHEPAVTIPLKGRDREKVELMSLLLDNVWQRDLPVFIVYGDNGIGKTALVQKVLSESEESGHFDYIIWVNGSPPYDESRMARDIIASLTNGVANEEENVVEEQSLLRVMKLLDGRKKYLFILDDLSFHDSDGLRWLRFTSFLWGGATGSTILVTTRDPKQMWRGKYLLYLEGLTQEDSSELILKTAFKGGVEQIIEPGKLQIAEEVASDCFGDPLFIRAVGGYLSLQHDMSNWSCFRDWADFDALSTLLYGGHPYGHLSPVVMRYNHLPPRVKQCFGLCSLFPKGHAMDRQTLAELWIALGYIKSTNEDLRSLEDIADDYFNQLLMEELFRVKIFDTFGKVRSVVLHPNAEDFARSVAGSECHALRGNDHSWGGEVKARHMSIIDCQNFHQYHHNFRKLRTLLYFGDHHNKIEFLWNYLIPHVRCELVRVLDVHHINFVLVPKDVRKLMHLRYLNLSDNRTIESLPPEITGLLNLKTLKLSGCWALKELPPDMQKMVSLRHLYINGCRKLCLMPKGLGDLKFLNILTDFILPPDDSSAIDSANLSDLGKLNDLRGSLRIPNLCYSEAAGETFEIQGLLDKKSSLESLELIFMNLPTDTSLLDSLRPHPNLKGLRIHNYGATQFPEWMTCPLTYLPNLVEIALIGCENCEYLPQFGQLRHLKSLTIQGLPDLLRMEPGPEQSSPDVANNAQLFGELSLLCIRDCPKLECLPFTPRLAKLTLVNVSEQLFRHPFQVAGSLKTLHLENIELLDRLPEEWLRDFTCLEELHIGSCPSLVSLLRGMMRLKHLETLSIWNCKELDLLKVEHDEVMELECLKSLKVLTIYKASKMVHLPEWLSHVSTLRLLFIRSCPYLVDLPEWIGNIEPLRLIELVHCPLLTSLPAGMCEFTNDYPWKLRIIGCPLLQSKGIERNCRL